MTREANITESELLTNTIVLNIRSLSCLFVCCPLPSSASAQYWVGDKQNLTSLKTNSNLCWHIIYCESLQLFTVHQESIIKVLFASIFAETALSARSLLPGSATLFENIFCVTYFVHICFKYYFVFSLQNSSKCWLTPPRFCNNVWQFFFVLHFVHILFKYHCHNVFSANSSDT